MLCFRRRSLRRQGFEELRKAMADKSAEFLALIVVNVESEAGD